MRFFNGWSPLDLDAVCTMLFRCPFQSQINFLVCIKAATQRKERCQGQKMERGFEFDGNQLSLITMRQVMEVATLRSKGKPNL